MIQPRSYNTTYFRPKQQCNAILVEVVCLSTIEDILKKEAYIKIYSKVSNFKVYKGGLYSCSLVEKKN